MCKTPGVVEIEFMLKITTLNKYIKYLLLYALFMFSTQMGCYSLPSLQMQKREL